MSMYFKWNGMLGQVPLWDEISMILNLSDSEMDHIFFFQSRDQMWQIRLWQRHCGNCANWRCQWRKPSRLRHLDKKHPWHWETRLNIILRNDRARDGGYVRNLTGLDPQVMTEVSCLDQKSQHANGTFGWIRSRGMEGSHHSWCERNGNGRWTCEARCRNSHKRNGELLHTHTHN